MSGNPRSILSLPPDVSPSQWLSLLRLLRLSCGSKKEMKVVLLSISLLVSQVQENLLLLSAQLPSGEEEKD